MTPEQEREIEKIAKMLDALRCNCGLRYCPIEERQRSLQRYAKLAAQDRPKLTPHQADALRFIVWRGGWTHAAAQVYAKDPIGNKTCFILSRCAYLTYVSWDEGYRVTERGRARAAELELEVQAGGAVPAWIAALIRENGLGSPAIESASP